MRKKEQNEKSGKASEAGTETISTSFIRSDLNTDGQAVTEDSEHHKNTVPEENSTKGPKWTNKLANVKAAEAIGGPGRALSIPGLTIQRHARLPVIHETMNRLSVTLMEELVPAPGLSSVPSAQVLAIIGLGTNAIKEGTIPPAQNPRGPAFRSVGVHAADMSTPTVDAVQNTLMPRDNTRGTKYSNSATGSSDDHLVPLFPWARS